MKVRSFLAFDISPKVKDKLGKLINDFAKKESGVRWIQSENLHVTLKFFGDVEEELLLGSVSKEIERVIINDAQITSLKCSGLGVFPNWKYPKVIWAGFIGDTEPVTLLQSELENKLSHFSFKKDERAFRLHLTIGRAASLKSSGLLMNLINELGPIEFGDVTIDHLTLYKSVLTKEGSVYTALKTFKIEKR